MNADARGSVDENNKVVDGCPPTRPGDPADPGTLHLDWLVVQLNRWRERGMQVWLTGHVPPTPSGWYDQCKWSLAGFCIGEASYTYFG